ncbi:MAG: hypothetical protein H0X39_15695 [Actinobacteria bacterium]|nr:hypothetical protein [Actinomycetota bacterium]
MRTFEEIAGDLAENADMLDEVPSVPPGIGDILREAVVALRAGSALDQLVATTQENGFAFSYDPGLNEPWSLYDVDEFDVTGATLADVVAAALARIADQQGET